MDIKFLEKLISTPSPSGFEKPVRELVKKQLEAHADEIKTDVHGNLIAAVNPGGSPRLMIAAHCDEVGFMIKHITKEGFIYFAAVGGVDAGIPAGRAVEIHAEKGVIPGVIGKVPVHLLREEDKKKKQEIYNLWIDVGAGSRKELDGLVNTGDVITFKPGFARLKNNLVSGRSFDDKAGVFVLTEMMKKISGRSIKPAVFAVSTVQEEVGLRGAATSAYSIKPEAGIAIDVDFSSDYPDTDKKRIGDISLGKGPVLSRGANINPVLGRLLIETAEKKAVPFQLSGSPRATGTDANVMQLSRSGVATALVGIPNRYMHTPVEIVSLDDMENAAELLTEFISSVKGGIDFTP